MQSMKFYKYQVKHECEKVHTSCSICATTGRPADRSNISTTHIHAAFNQELQADYLYVTIHEERHEVLNLLDTVTCYVERFITASRSAENMKRQFDNMWFGGGGGTGSNDLKRGYSSTGTETQWETTFLRIRQRLNLT